MARAHDCPDQRAVRSGWRFPTMSLLGDTIKAIPLGSGGVLWVLDAGSRGGRYHETVIRFCLWCGVELKTLE